MAGQDILPAESQPTAMLPASVLPDRLSAMRAFVHQPAVKRALPGIGMLGAAGIAGLAWWALYTPAQAPLFQGLRDADKAAVADALQSAGIAYSVDRDTGSIDVAQDEIHKARMMLAGQGLPKAAPAGDALIASLPMGSSRAVEGETLRGAREADLARTIEAIETVKSARIHIAIPEASVFVRDKAEPAASVMLTLQDGRSLSQAQVRAIRHLVASSVPSLAPDQVSIVDQSGALLSQDDGSSDNPAFAVQLQMEQRYRQALVSLLAPVVGLGNFSAEVHVDTDPSESQSTRETFPKDASVLRQEEGNRTATSSSAGTPAIGIPGALSNQPPPATQVTAQPPASAPVPAARAPGVETNETYTRRFDVGREISVTHQPIGTVRRVTVAVALRNQKGEKPKTTVEIAAIESLVKGAIGFDAARGDVVAISARAFAETSREAVSFWDKPWFLALIRQVGALLAAILAFIFIGRPLMKRMRSAAAMSSETATGGLRGPGVAQTRPISLDMIAAAPGYTDRAALVRDFVKQNPERATEVVRQMVREGGHG
jgi:flagellar M-ring protein FliF